MDAGEAEDRAVADFVSEIGLDRDLKLRGSRGSDNGDAEVPFDE